MELKSTEFTQDASALQKTADFVQAFMLGFEIQVCASFWGGEPIGVLGVPCVCIY